MFEPTTRPPIPLRPGALIGIVLTGIFASAVMGGLTNSINGWVSPEYFRTVMRWDHVEDVWRASIAQGIFEGTLFGILFSLLYTVGVAIITGGRCEYVRAMVYLLGIVAGVFVCWLLGGLIAMGLGTLSPEFYRSTFRGVPMEFNAMLRYAWVGGSIWGIYFGGLVSIILGLLLLRNNWRHDPLP